MVFPQRCFRGVRVFSLCQLHNKNRQGFDKNRSCVLAVNCLMLYNVFNTL